MTESTAKPWYRRKRLSIPLLLLWFITLFLSVLPSALEVWLPGQWLKLGGRQAHIENLDFNLFTGRLELQGLSLTGAQQEHSHLKRLLVDVAPTALLKGQIRVQSVEINGLLLPLEVLEQIRIAGIALPEPKAEQPPGPATEDKPFSLPKLRLEQIKLSDLQIDYRDAVGSNTLKLNRLILGLADTEAPNQQTPLELNLALNQQDIQIEAELEPFRSIPTASGKLLLNDFDLSRFAAYARPSLSTLAGQLSIDSDWSVKLEPQQTLIAQNGTLALKNLNLLVPAPSPELGDAAISLSVELEQQLNINIDNLGPSLKQQGQLTVMGLNLKTTPYRVALQNLNWQGQIDLDHNSPIPSASGSIMLKKLQGFDEALQQSLFSLQALELDNIGLKGDAGSQISVTHNGTLNLQQLELNIPEQLSGLTAPLSLKQDIQLQQTLQLQSSGQGLNIEQNGQLQISQMQLDLAPITAQLESLVWQGSIKQTAAESQPEVLGELHLHQLSSQAAEIADPLVSLADLKLDQLQYRSSEAQFKQLSLNDFKALAATEQPPMLSWQDWTLKDLHWQPGLVNTISLGSSLLQKPNMQARLNADGEVEGLTALLANLPIAPASPAPSTEISEAPSSAIEPDTKSTLVYQVGQFAVSGPGKIEFEDRSVQPHFKTTWQLNQISGSDWKSGKPAKLSLDMQSGKNTTLKGSAELLFLEPSANTTANIELKNFSLPPVSSYSAKAMGYGFETGSVDAEVTAKLEQRQIDSNIKLGLDYLEMVKLQEKNAEKMNSAIGMPLNLALSTLEDKNRHIDLEIPVKGDIDKPDFELGKILRTATGGALKTASVSYLKYALQPYSSLISIFSWAGKQATNLRLQPIEFEAGKLQVSANQTEILDKISKLLKDRPGLKLKVCGVSTTADQKILIAQLKDEFEKQQQTAAELAKQQGKDFKAQAFKADEGLVQSQLAQLADQRSSAVIDLMQNEFSVGENRFIECLSSSELQNEEEMDKKTENGRVELLL